MKKKILIILIMVLGVLICAERAQSKNMDTFVAVKLEKNSADLKPFTIPAEAAYDGGMSLDIWKNGKGTLHREKRSDPVTCKVDGDKLTVWEDGTALLSGNISGDMLRLKMWFSPDEIIMMKKDSELMTELRNEYDQPEGNYFGVQEKGYFLGAFWNGNAVKLYKGGTGEVLFESDEREWIDALWKENESGISVLTIYETYQGTIKNGILTLKSDSENYTFGKIEYLQ